MILILIMSILLTPRWFTIPDNVQHHPIIAPMKQDLVSGAYDIYTVVAGRRSFKTETGKRFMVLKALSNNDCVYHIGAPTRQQAKEIFWKDIKDLIHPVFIKDKSETELKIKLINGTVINVIGLKEFRRIEGGRSHGALLSEFQECDLEVYSQSFEPMLNDTGGFLIAEGRPHGKNHLFDFYQMGVTGQIGCSSYHWTAETVLTPQQILKAKSRLAKLDYEREYEASFETGGISPYYAYGTENNKVLTEFDVSELIICSDFNATEKPMSWNIGKQVGEFTYWIKTFSHQFTNTETMCGILDEYLTKIGFWDKAGTLNWYGDYAGKHKTSNSNYSDWDIIRNKFEGRCDYQQKIKPCRSIPDSIAATNARLCNTNNERRMFIDPEECKSLVDDWNKGEWKDNGRELSEKDPLRGHCCRAVDYFTDYEYPIIPKATFIQT